MSKMKFFLVIACILSISLPAFAQNRNREERVEWRKLTWDDFKGEPDSDSSFIAFAYTEIRYDFGYGNRGRWRRRNNSGSQTEYWYNVRAFLVPKKSWVKPEKDTEQTLKHEQVHFDITEVYARMIRKYLEEHKFSSNNIDDKIKKVIDQYGKWRQEAQDKYDEETVHGTDAEKQKEWEEKVAKQLKESDEYKLPAIN